MRLGHLTKEEMPLGCNGNKIGQICLLPRDGLPGETAPNRDGLKLRASIACIFSMLGKKETTK